MKVFIIKSYPLLIDNRKVVFFSEIWIIDDFIKSLNCLVINLFLLENQAAIELLYTICKTDKAFFVLSKASSFLTF